MSCIVSVVIAVALIPSNILWPLILGGKTELDIQLNQEAALRSVKTDITFMLAAIFCMQDVS